MLSLRLAFTAGTVMTTSIVSLSDSCNISQRPNISSLESFFGGRPRLNVVGFVDMRSKTSDFAAGLLNSAFSVASAVCCIR